MKKLVEILILLMLGLAGLFVLPCCDKLDINPSAPLDTLWFEHFNRLPDNDYPWWIESANYDLCQDGPVAGSAPCLKVSSYCDYPLGDEFTVQGAVIDMRPPQWTYTNVTLRFWMKIELSPGKQNLDSLYVFAIVHNWYNGLERDTFWGVNLQNLKLNKWILIEKDVTELWRAQIPGDDSVQIYLVISVIGYPKKEKGVTINLYLDEVVVTASPPRPRYRLASADPRRPGTD